MALMPAAPVSIDTSGCTAPRLSMMLPAVPAVRWLRAWSRMLCAISRAITKAMPSSFCAALSMPRVSMMRAPSEYALILSALPRATRKAQARVTGIFMSCGWPSRAMVMFRLALFEASGPTMAANGPSALGPAGSGLPSAASKPSPLRKPARAAPLPGSTPDTCICSP